MIMQITKKSIKRTMLISIPNHRNQLEHLSERYKKQKHHIIKNLKKKKKKKFNTASKNKNAKMQIIAMLRFMLL